MSTALYKALIAAKAPEDLAERAAEGVPVSDRLATKADLARLEVHLMRLMLMQTLAIVAAVAALIRFL